jgi:hypothetical protein
MSFDADYDYSSLDPMLPDIHENYCNPHDGSQSLMQTHVSSTFGLATGTLAGRAPMRRVTP